MRGSFGILVDVDCCRQLGHFGRFSYWYHHPGRHQHSILQGRLLVELWKELEHFHKLHSQHQDFQHRDLVDDGCVAVGLLDHPTKRQGTCGLRKSEVLSVALLHLLTSHFPDPLVHHHPCRPSLLGHQPELCRPKASSLVPRQHGSRHQDRRCRVGH